MRPWGNASIGAKKCDAERPMQSVPTRERGNETIFGALQALGDKKGSTRIGDAVGTRFFRLRKIERRQSLDTHRRTTTISSSPWIARRVARVCCSDLPSGSTELSSPASNFA